MMEKDKNLSETTSEAYIKLASLLQKKRNRDKTERVERILQSNLDPLEKIRRIDRIDNEKQPVETDNTEQKREDFRTLLREENLFNAAAARELRKKIRIEYPARSYLSYLFKEYGKIKRFCADSGFFVNSVFPPVIKVKSSLLEVFWMRCTRDAADLSELTIKILDNGWLHLHKFEYNLIVQFHKLCRKIVETDFSMIKEGAVNTADRLRSLETLYITCNYRSVYRESIVTSIFYIVENYPEWGYDSAVMARKVKRLLVGDQRSGSMSGFITGFNIIKTRTFLKFEDLFVGGYETLINNDDFECGDNIRKQIDTYIERTIESVIESRNRKEEKDRIEKYISFDKENRYDYAGLAYFYDKSSGADSGTLYDDSSGVIRLMINFCDAFIKTYEPLLNDRITLDTGSRVAVFAPGSFQVEISKIRFGIQKLARYKFSFPKFSRNEYSENVNQHKKISGPKFEIIQVVSDILSRMNEISDKLIDVLTSCEPDDSSGDSRSEPVDPSFVKGRVISVPFRKRKISSISFINGKTVGAAISEIVTLILMLQLYLGDERLSLILESGKRLEAEIEKKREMIKRIATIRQYKSIAEKYNI